MNGQPDFGVAPSLTVDLQFIPNERSWKKVNRDRRIIDLSDFPRNQRGVYVIRFRDLLFSRLDGESSILKVGEASDSFFSRFRAYNQKNEAATATCSLSEFLSGCSAGFTDFSIMWALPRLLKRGPIVIDLYYCKDTKTLQRQMLSQCLDAYLDMPPLNRGLA